MSYLNVIGKQEKPKVYTLRKSASPAPENAIYVGRGNDPRGNGRVSTWGNPHVMNGQSAREHARVTELYRRDIELMVKEQHAAFVQKIAIPLKNKDLVCWCQSPDEPPEKRKDCHAVALRDAVWEYWKGNHSK
jgi:hypothetical protein